MPLIIEFFSSNFKYFSVAILITFSLQDVEDTKLLSGYIAEYFFKDYELAQNLYLQSSKSSAALEMRKHLFHWDAALKLAVTLSPKEVPMISKEYAEQLEFTYVFLYFLFFYYFCCF